MTNENWKSGTIYQIYPRSFKDTNNDGFGDIKGIIEKLDYLENLGVSYLSLTPMYVSPQRDNGYDIADYYNIDSKFGTMADFEELLNKAHEKNIRIMMDLVVNHTSSAHYWFQEALKGKDNPYRNYYIWKDPVNGKEPNNWVSKFSGSAWEYEPNSGQYYLHLYEKTMPDLNWENPKLREEIITMMKWWAEKGIDGFRLDVINNISKDQSFPNDTLETPKNDGRTYYSDGPRIHEFLHLMNKEVFTPYQLVTVGELSSTTPEQVILYTKPERQELSMAFNFHHMKVDYPNGEKWAVSDYQLTELKKIMAYWQQKMYNEGGWNALFWTNHDQPRALARFLDDEEFRIESAKNLAITEFGLHGTTFVYQGEEIAMKDAYFQNISEYDDRESINAYNMMIARGDSKEYALAALRQKSRDNCRIPMQWTDEKYYGFSTHKPWLMGPTHDEVNVERALEDKNSVFYTYQKLIKFRKEMPIFVKGDFELIDAENNQVFAYKRVFDDETLLVVSNFTSETIRFDTGINLTEGSQVLVANYPRKIVTQELELQPFEAMMILKNK